MSGASWYLITSWLKIWPRAVLSSRKATTRSMSFMWAIITWRSIHVSISILIATSVLGPRAHTVSLRSGPATTKKERRMAEYAHPEVLVSTAWVAEHHTDPNVRIVESDEDILLYDVGHIPGAVKIDWQSELQHQVIRDYVDQEAFGKLVGSKGISNDHTVVFYGDRNNWWACYAFWVFKMYGHRDCRIMNGGRQKWIDDGRAITPERPTYPAVPYTASGPDLRIRAFRQEVME